MRAGSQSKSIEIPIVIGVRAIIIMGVRCTHIAFLLLVSACKEVASAELPRTFDPQVVQNFVDSTSVAHFGQ
jgi:hypothetical protein